MMIEVSRDQRDVYIAALANGLAIVHSLEHSETARVFLNLSRYGIHVACACMRPERLPCLDRCTRCLNGGVHISCRSLPYAGEFFTGGRIGGIEVLSSGRIN